LARSSAVLTTVFRWILKAILAVIGTPIVRAQWEALLGDRLSEPPAGSSTGKGEDFGTGVGKGLRLVGGEREEPGGLASPAFSLADEALDGGSGHGAA